MFFWTKLYVRYCILQEFPWLAHGHPIPAPPALLHHVCPMQGCGMEQTGPSPKDWTVMGGISYRPAGSKWDRGSTADRAASPNPNNRERAPVSCCRAFWW